MSATRTPTRDRRLERRLRRINGKPPVRECLGAVCLAGFAALALGRPPFALAVAVAGLALAAALGWLAGYRRHRQQAALDVEYLIGGAAMGGVVTAWLAAATIGEPLAPRALARAAFEPGVVVVGLAIGEDVLRRILGPFRGGVFPPP